MSEALSEYEAGAVVGRNNTLDQVATEIEARAGKYFIADKTDLAECLKDLAKWVRSLK